MIGLNSSSSTETKTLEFAPFSDIDTTTGGGTGAYFETGTYSASNSGESTVGSYFAISNQSGTDNDGGKKVSGTFVLTSPFRMSTIRAYGKATPSR